MSPAIGTAPPRAAKPRRTRYTPLWVEALAYHEAGHAMMAVALGIPVARVAIAEACDLADSNGLVEYAGDMKGITPLKHALCLLASGPAEDLAPNRAAFKRLRGFATGRRNDARLAFLAMSAPYLMLRLAESTARREFRWTTGPLVDDVMEQPENRAVVREMGAILMSRKAMDAAAVEGFRGRTVLPDEVARECEPL